MGCCHSAEHPPEVRAVRPARSTRPPQLAPIGPRTGKLVAEIVSGSASGANSAANSRGSAIPYVQSITSTMDRSRSSAAVPYLGPMPGDIILNGDVCLNVDDDDDEHDGRDGATSRHSSGRSLHSTASATSSAPQRPFQQQPRFGARGNYTPAFAVVRGPSPASQPQPQLFATFAVEDSQNAPPPLLGPPPLLTASAALSATGLGATVLCQSNVLSDGAGSTTKSVRFRVAESDGSGSRGTDNVRRIRRKSVAEELMEEAALRFSVSSGAAQPRAATAAADTPPPPGSPSEAPFGGSSDGAVAIADAEIPE